MVLMSLMGMTNGTTFLVQDIGGHVGYRYYDRIELPFYFFAYRYTCGISHYKQSD